jgi:hypothetical protein
VVANDEEHELAVLVMLPIRPNPLESVSMNSTLSPEPDTTVLKDWPVFSRIVPVQS